MLKTTPPCPRCGKRLARSFTKDDYVCLSCNRTWEDKDVRVARATEAAMRGDYAQVSEDLFGGMGKKK